jgi:hypothetical protein
MRVQLKGVAHIRKKLADGQVRNYWYAWRGGPRLEGSPGTAEFIISYNGAIAARKRPLNNDLSFILDAYQDAEAFRCLASKTKRDYARSLTSIRKKFGDCPIKILGDRRVRGDFLEWRDEIAKYSPRQADYVITVFARALSWALDRGMISVNLLERPGRVWSGSRAEKVWTNADEARFLEVASAQMALAFMLGLWTGQDKAISYASPGKPTTGTSFALGSPRPALTSRSLLANPSRQFWTQRPAYHPSSSPPRTTDPTRQTVFALHGARLVTELV